ncbi:MAG: amino acid permease [Proteobacteria bacterium]|nr:amino acid permease [Pseudomonadota bacterium]
MTALPRRLGVWTAAMAVVGIIVGSGIFRVPSSVATDLHSVGTIGAVWVAGGLITLCLALSLAELAALYPSAGGSYVYIREAYGPMVAFLYGWTFMLINPAVWAGIALIFAEYLSHFIPLGLGARRAVAATLIGFATLANYRSVWLAVALQNIAAIAKSAAIFVVAAVIFALGTRMEGAFAAPVSFDFPSVGVVGGALIGVLFAYEGAASFCALSGEIKEPGRSLPLALTAGVGIVIVLYLLINAAYLYVLPLKAVASSNLVAADAVMKVGGQTAAGLVAALVMLTTFGALISTAIADPRVFYAMSTDGLFFRNVGAVHPRFQTPHLAVLMSGAIAVLYVSLHNFEELTAIFILGLWPFYALTAFAVIVLRFKHPTLERPYRTPGYPLVPLIFVASGILMLASSLVQQTRLTLIDMSITLAGIPVYFVWRAVGR